MYEILLIAVFYLCERKAFVFSLRTIYILWVDCVSVIWTLALVQCVVALFHVRLLPPPSSFPPQCCGHHWHVPCVSVVLQVRAASTVTSWSNQTPAALPTVPPLQVGSAPDHQVLWTPTQPSHNVLRCWCLQMITRSLAWLMLQPTCCWSIIVLPAFSLK